MSDLINKEALRKRMYHEAFEKDSKLQRWDSGCWIRYKMFEDVLEDMPTWDRWIPADENLPPMHEEVLLSMHDDLLERKVFIGARIGEDEVLLHNDAFGLIYRTRHIDAWMPLPASYGSGENDD